MNYRGINDLPVAKVVEGDATVFQYHGKHAHANADKALTRLNKGISSDQNIPDLLVKFDKR